MKLCILLVPFFLFGCVKDELDGVALENNPFEADSGFVPVRVTETSTSGCIIKIFLEIDATHFNHDRPNPRRIAVFRNGLLKQLMAPGALTYTDPQVTCHVAYTYAFALYTDTENPDAPVAVMGPSIAFSKQTDPIELVPVP